VSTFKSCLDLCRISNLPTVWTNVLLAYLLASGELSLVPYMTLAIAISAFYMAGMSLNDVCDAAYDSLHRPSRPIPAGRISRRDALLLTITLFATGVALLPFLPYRSGLAAGVALVLTIVVYDLHHKGNPFSVFIMAACRFLIFAVVSLAVSGRLVPLVLAAGMIQFLYVVSISVVARHEGDRSHPFPFPVIPAMLAGISLLDGVLLAVLISIPWLLAGAAGALATWSGQRYVRGD
jgi:4-hydroxybenzoate polyprenyltransferase